MTPEQAGFTVLPNGQIALQPEWDHCRAVLWVAAHRRHILERDGNAAEHTLSGAQLRGSMESMCSELHVEFLENEQGARGGKKWWLSRLPWVPEAPSGLAGADEPLRGGSRPNNQTLKHHLRNLLRRTFGNHNLAVTFLMTGHCQGVADIWQQLQNAQHSGGQTIGVSGAQPVLSAARQRERRQAKNYMNSLRAELRKRGDLPPLPTALCQHWVRSEARTVCAKCGIANCEECTRFGVCRNSGHCNIRRAAGGSAAAPAAQVDLGAPARQYQHWTSDDLERELASQEAIVNATTEEQRRGQLSTGNWADRSDAIRGTAPVAAMAYRGFTPAWATEQSGRCIAQGCGWGQGLARCSECHAWLCIAGKSATGAGRTRRGTAWGGT